MPSAWRARSDGPADIFLIAPHSSLVTSRKSVEDSRNGYRRCGFRYEKKLRITGVSSIAGIDEAGRGALAGPVVAAAAILPEKFRHRRLNDSKQLAAELR